MIGPTFTAACSRGMSSEQALRESMVGAGILTFSACCNEEETFDLPMSLGISYAKFIGESGQLLSI